MGRPLVTAIQWTDETWNPVTGCDQVSPGCDHCYALTMAARLKAMGQAKYQRDGDPRTSGPGFGVTCHPDIVNNPLSWRKPRRVFVNSMSDLWHPQVPDGFIAWIWWVMSQTPEHTYQILTKRPKRMAAWVRRWNDLDGETNEFRDARGPVEVRAAHPSGRGQLFAGMLEQWGDPPEGAAYPPFDWMEGMRWWPTWPPFNIWLGTSIENADYLWRADALRGVDAAVRFLSLEPLLGPLPDLNLDGIHWVIVGGESGRNARPMDLDWARGIRDQCQTAGVAFFMKQLGGTGSHRGDPGGWPEDLRVREYPEGLS